MNEKEKAKIILKTLNKIYPQAPVPLKSKNTFTLLISVLLSAQCTDVNVNNVTKDIYPKYYRPEHFVKLGRKKIEKLIKKIGIFRIKAKSIYLMSKKILEEHNGKVPKTFDQLEKNNQLLRHKINQKIVNLEIDKDKKALKEVYALMRSMHQRRKVSDFIGLLQQSES